jgi:hypothetical protein
MTYPYKAWVLMPSFKPVEVEIVSGDRGYERTSKLKDYKNEAVHLTKEGAIAYGWELIAKEQAAMWKRQDRSFKRRAALNKAT